MEELAPALAKLMAQLLIQNPNAVVVLSHQTRALRTDGLFFRELDAALLENARATSINAPPADDGTVQVVKLPRPLLPEAFGRRIEVLNVFVIGCKSRLRQLRLQQGIGDDSSSISEEEEGDRV